MTDLYQSRPGAPYTADRQPVLNETAFAASMDAVREAFEKGEEEEGQGRAAIVAYLAALPAPEKPARVEPAANPHKKNYVMSDASINGRPVYAPVANWMDVPTLVRGVDSLCALTHSASWNAGWYHDPKTEKLIERNVGEVIALMHSELSEGLEGYRKGLMDDHLPHRLQIEVEFADAVIRIADTCGHLGLDLAGAIVEKMRYNATREDHKLEARAKGGKAF